jgi:ethanolamine utilization protein EutA
VETPGGGSLKAERHLYEGVFYVVGGRAATEVWTANDQGRRYALLAESPTMNWPLAPVSRSGGVAAFVYGREYRDFGDLGGEIASRLIDRIQDAGVELLSTTSGIRATVVGAATATAQLRGETVYAEPARSEDPELRDLLIVRPMLPPPAATLDVSTVRNSVQAAMATARHAPRMALAIDWEGPLEYRSLDIVARGITEAWSGDADRACQVLAILLNRDLAGLLGTHLRQVVELPTRVVVIDGVEARSEHDYIDIGEVVEGTGAVAIVYGDAVTGTLPT